MSLFKQNGLPEDIYYRVQRIYRDLRHEAATLVPLRTECLIENIEAIYSSPAVELIKKAGLDDIFFGEFSIPKLTILYGHEKIIPVLKKFNVDLEETQPDGHTFASIASMTGRIPMLKALHEAGVNLTSPDVNGDTPMTWALPEHGTHTALVELVRGKAAGEEYIRGLKEKIIAAFKFSGSGDIGGSEKTRRLTELRYNVQEFYSPYVSKRRQELGIDDLIPGSGSLTIKNKAQQGIYNDHIGFIFYDDTNTAHPNQVLEQSIQEGPAAP